MFSRPSGSSRPSESPVRRGFRDTGENGQRAFYHDLGVAWKKDNGVISAKLYGLPINGVLIIVPNEDRVEAGK